jgi:hypothetical protein
MLYAFQSYRLNTNGLAEDMEVEKGKKLEKPVPMKTDRAWNG